MGQGRSAFKSHVTLGSQIYREAGAKPEDDVYLALELFMRLAMRFEEHQGDVFGYVALRHIGVHTSYDSSFSEEDLVSDLLAFNMAAEGLKKDKIREACGGFTDPKVREKVSLNVWDNMPGQKLAIGYKKWTPNYHTKDTCGYCTADDEGWPFDKVPWHPDNPRNSSRFCNNTPIGPIARVQGQTVFIEEYVYSVVQTITKTWTWEDGWKESVINHMEQPPRGYDGMPMYYGP